MMAVHMETPSALSSRERAQHLYTKNVELENTRHKSTHSRVPYDPTVWQQIRENYEAIILEDHTFSEQHEIELALWQLHYRRIEELRALFKAAVSSNTASVTQNGKGGPARPDRLSIIRGQFKTFLSEATGFYHELILKIRAKYGLPLNFFSDDPENQFILSKDGHKSTDMTKGLLSCHRCLIYLGDLARYKGIYGDEECKSRDFAAASSYYAQASSLWPSSGNPHHQLAIVASYHGDEFATIYRYFRSLAVGSPFSTARDNLIIAFERNRQNYLQLLGDSKTSKAKVVVPRMNSKVRGRGEAKSFSKDIRSQSTPSKEKAVSIPETFKAFTVKFVRVNGILFTRTSLETFADVLSMTKNEFMVLLSSGSEEQYNFGSDAAECGLFIVRMVAILIFTVYNVNRESENQSYAEILQRSVLLQNAYTAVFEFMGHVIERCSQSHDSLSSYLLPGVLVFVEWLASHPDVATFSEPGEDQANARLFFWNACISFFNKLLLSGFSLDGEDESCFFNTGEYDEGETGNRLALWEDFELRGFLPLHPAQQILNFSGNHSLGNDGSMKEKKTRVKRIIAAGKTFSSVVRVGEQGIYFDPTMKKFIIGAEPQSCADFTPSSGPDMLMLNCIGQEPPIDKKQNVDVLKSALPMFELEDEEEVIVFKPSVVDKQADAIFTSYEDLGLVPNMTPVDSGGYNRSLSASPDEIVRQNGFNSIMRPPASVINANTPSSWPSYEPVSLANGFNNISLMGDGNLINQRPSDHPSILQSAALSLPFSQSINVNPGSGYPMAMPEVMPPKIVVNMSSQTDNVCNFKPQSISSVNSKKNPVSRPTRHTGPPPGFTPAPKCSDLPGWSSMKGENPIIDDYSWLDGYQKPFSGEKNSVFNLDTNLSGSVFNHLDKSYGVPGAISFPFPGKQASTFHVPIENHITRQEYQFSDHLKLYEQQQQPKVSQPVSLPKQFQSQSLWEGRFLV
ncbi:nonsense-mediated mRNA decay factor SMG7-like [Silene latifolia]|uniref:nonsense-mediated mRNA decay factor SMG7-like n=1 Tax=Silene latifolia TaxID=37657 RepID=UPI003D76D729